MNPMIQFDRHPDADALNAFAEQALPVADRARILAHMAGCPRCREVVYLAQAAAEPAPVPSIAIKAEPPRPWISAFAWWRIALIPAAALAATGAIVLWMQLRPAPAPTQIAKMSEPQLAPVSPDPAKIVQKSAPRPASVAPRPPAAPTPRVEQKKAMPPAIGAMDPSSSGLVAASAAPSPSAAQARALAGTHLDAHSASMARYESLPAPPVPPPAFSLAPSSVSPQLQPQPEAVLRPAPAAKVSAAAASPSPQPLSGFAPVRLSTPLNLPSGLGAVSSAAMLNRLLAVDTAGAVFLSQDAGKHWESVNAQWTGKAIQVHAPPPDIYRLRTADAAASVEPAPAPQPPAMLFRLLTDRRQTWVSADGKVWRRQ